MQMPVGGVAAADASLAVTMAVTNMVGEVIQQFGSSEQKRHYCPKLASGEFFAGAFALSEPGSGQMQLRYRPKLCVMAMNG